MPKMPPDIREYIGLHSVSTIYWELTAGDAKSLNQFVPRRQTEKMQLLF